MRVWDTGESFAERSSIVVVIVVVVVPIGFAMRCEACCVSRNCGVFCHDISYRPCDWPSPCRPTLFPSSMQVSCVDVNPRVPTLVLTTGGDHLMRLWDARKDDHPLFTVKHARMVRSSLAHTETLSHRVGDDGGGGGARHCCSLVGVVPRLRNLLCLFETGNISSWLALCSSVVWKRSQEHGCVHCEGCALFFLCAPQQIPGAYFSPITGSKIVSTCTDSTWYSVLPLLRIGA
jgi:WD40 repeat protein